MAERVDCIISARNREWILPTWLESLENQTRKPDRVCVVDNSARKETAQTNWLKEMTIQNRLSYVPFPADDDEEWERGKYTRDTFCKIVNKVFDVFLDGGNDWLFMLDSDQTCGPEAIEKLLALGVPVSGVVIPTHVNPGIYNFLSRSEDVTPTGSKFDRRGLKFRKDIYNPYPKLQSERPFQVDFISGALMLRRDVVSQVRCIPGHPNWEYGAIWEDYPKLGLPLPMVDPTIPTAHYMKQGEPPLVWNPVDR